MGSFTQIPGSIATIVTNIPNWIRQAIEDPQQAFIFSVGIPVLSLGAGCELVPGCSSLELPP